MRAAPARSRAAGRPPVVSVGNLAMGGRGKTPLVAHLARRLVAAGARPAILSRGYGRRVIEDGVVIVSDGTHLLADLDRSGDEPLMLARSVPGAVVLVCEQRQVAGALARALGASVLVLDDGFQHRAMRRELDLVAIAPDDLQDRRVPFGRLRESPAALARASAVIVDGDLPAADRERIPVPVFTARRSLAPPVPLEPAQAAPAPGSEVVVLCAIARPDRFVRALDAAGYHVRKALIFRDHHRFSAADLRRVAAAVRETGAEAVLTTDKDAVRLLPRRPLPVPVCAVPLVWSIEPAFDAWFDARLREIGA